MMLFDRLLVLLAAGGLLWALESRWPLFVFGRDRAGHATPNLALAALTIVTNVAVMWAVGGGVIASPRVWPLWLEMIFGVAALDLATWLAHRLMHALPWVWRVHRVHHADAAVDVTTAFRQHPGETVWRLAFRVAPVAAFDIPIAVVAVYETLSALNALLEHANVAVPERIDHAFRWLVVTPNMHKWHHSRDARETDTNYGNIFSFWDRAFGTFTDRSELAGLRYGLDGFDDARSKTLGGLLRMPVAQT